MRHIPFTLSASTGTIDTLTPLALWSGSQALSGPIRIIFTSVGLTKRWYYLAVTTATTTHYLPFYIDDRNLTYDVPITSMALDKTATAISLGIYDDNNVRWAQTNGATVSGTTPCAGSYSALMNNNLSAGASYIATSGLSAECNLGTNTFTISGKRRTPNHGYGFYIFDQREAYNKYFRLSSTGRTGGHFILEFFTAGWQSTLLTAAYTLTENAVYTWSLSWNGTSLVLTVNGATVVWASGTPPAAGANFGLTADFAFPTTLVTSGMGFSDRSAIIDDLKLVKAGATIFENTFENVSAVNISSMKGLYDASIPASYIPITYIEIDLDLCSQTFGTSPCLATGAKCFNTFGTCKYISAFNKGTAKTLAFCGNAAPLPFKTGERPYIKAVKYLPTEVKNDLAITGRVNVQMYDEPDGDIGVDPYVSSRTRPVLGTFWMKLLARNPNYKNRRIRISEGWLGDSYSTMTTTRLVFSGLLDSIRVDQSGTVVIEAVDKLSALKEIEVPVKVALSVYADTAVDAAVIATTGIDIASIATAGYVLIDENIIQYTGISGNALTGCTWGKFNTVKTAVSAGASIQLVKYYAPDHPFDHLLAIIQAAGYTVANDVDQDSFAEFAPAVDPAGDITVANKLGWRDWPEPDNDISAVITQPVKLSKLITEIADTIGARIWVNEDNKIQITRPLPNKPGRSYTAINDDYHIVLKSDSLTIDEDKRLSRARVYWGKYALGDVDDPENYRYVEMVVDADAEASSLYADAIQIKTLYSRWINTDCANSDPYATMSRIAKTWALRWVARSREAPKYLEVTLTRKDSAIATGEFLAVTTDSLVDRFGNGLSAWPFLVIKREQTGSHEFKYTLEKLSDRRVAIIGGASMTDYTSATAAEKEYGYVGNASGLQSNDDPGYNIY